MSSNKKNALKLPEAKPAPSIVLVRPQLGENIGKTARAMLNFGLIDLRLVAPRDGWPNMDAGPSAAGADSVLANAQVFDDLGEALHDIQHVYALTARKRDMQKRAVTGIEAVEEMARSVGHGEKVALLFGPERSGLSNDDLLYADTIASYPTNPEFGSLNLAQAVILFAYDWTRTQGADLGPEWSQDEKKATKKELIGLFDQLEEALDDRGYFHPEARRNAMVQTLRNLLQSAQFTSQHVQTLRGAIRALIKPASNKE